MPRSHHDKAGEAAVSERSSRHTRRASDASPEPPRRSRRTARTPEQSPVRDSDRRGRRDMAAAYAEDRNEKKSAKKGRDRSASLCSSSSNDTRHARGRRDNRKARHLSPAQISRSSSSSQSGSALSSDVSSLAFSEDSVQFVPSRQNSVGDTAYRLQVFENTFRNENNVNCVDGYWDRVLTGPSAEGKEVFQKLRTAKAAKHKALNEKIKAYNAKIPAKNAAIEAKNARREQQGRPPYGIPYEEEKTLSSCSQDTNVTVEEYQPVTKLEIRPNSADPTLLSEEFRRLKMVAEDGEYFERVQAVRAPAQEEALTAFFISALPRKFRKPVIRAIEERVEKDEKKRLKKEKKMGAVRKEPVKRDQPRRSLSRGGPAVRREPMED